MADGKMAETYERIRKALDGFLPSALYLSDDDVELLRQNYVTDPASLQYIQIETLVSEPHPLPRVLLDLIAGAKSHLAKKQRVTPPDISAEILKNLIHPVPTALPPVEELGSYLTRVEQPLPVTKRVYELLGLVAGGNASVRVCEEQEDAQVVATFCARILETIHTAGTEELTAYGVTKLVFDVLHQVDVGIEPPLRLSLRYDKNASTKGTFSVPNTANTRPDGTGVVKYTLLLAGEEKAEEATIAQAKVDVKTKFKDAFSIMHYGTLPYIVAYAAAGKRIEFYALLTRTAELVPVLEELDFSTPEGRAKLLLVVVNLYRLMLVMKRQLPEEHGGLQMFQKVQREGRATVEATTNSVLKTVLDATAYFAMAGTTFETVANTYKVARSTVYLVHACRGPTLDRATNVYRVTLQPLGFPAAPKSESDFQLLVHHLLHALDHLHQQKLCHRDVREPNIIGYMDRGTPFRFVLIDLESVAPFDAPLPDVLFDAWSDDTLVDGTYGPASDLFQAAKMVKAMARDRGIALSDEGKECIEKIGGKEIDARSLLGEAWVGCKCAEGFTFSQE